jgi:hypothetical protein
LARIASAILVNKPPVRSFTTLLHGSRDYLCSDAALTRVRMDRNSAAISRRVAIVSAA